MGEPLAQPSESAADSPALRTRKDLIEEELFARRRDLFSELSVVFLDTTSLSFTGAGGETLGERGYSKDHRPDLPQVVIGMAVTAALVQRAIVMRAQPTHQLGNLAIRPHPCRPSRKGVEDIFRAFSLSAFHVAIDAITIWPVTFDRDEREPLFRYEAARDFRAPRVKLRGAVRCLSEQDQPRLAYHLDERVDMRGAIQGKRDVRDLSQYGFACGFRACSSRECAHVDDGG